MTTRRVAGPGLAGVDRAWARPGRTLARRNGDVARQVKAIVWVVEEAVGVSEDYMPACERRTRAAARRERKCLTLCFRASRFRVAKYGRIGLDTNGPRKMVQRELFRSDTR
jgi:hypothetical protein